MIAEILAIGSEIVSGAKLDTNSQWLSQQLGERGIHTLFHTSLADDLAANTMALEIASRRADVVMISGGLGPTLDDLTRQVMAAAFSAPLVCDAASLAQIEGMFQRRGREMPERNRVQALFPAGSLPLPNPIGTAPGIWMEVPRARRSACLIAALPGVPSELKRMFADQVAPRLPSTGNVIRHARIHCFGCGESQAEKLLGDLTARGNDPEIGITAHEATITLRIQAVAATEAECDRKIAAASQSIRERLGEFVFGTDDEELVDVVLAELIRRGQRLAVIDCGTKGWLAHALFSTTGSANRAFAACLSVSRRDEAARCLDLALAEKDSPTLAALGAAARAHFSVEHCFVIDEAPDEGDDDLTLESRHIDVLVSSPAGDIQGQVTRFGNPAILPARLGKAALDLLRRRFKASEDKTDLA